MERQDLLQGLYLNHYHPFHQKIQPEAAFQGLSFVADRQPLMPAKSDAAEEQLPAQVPGEPLWLPL